MDRRFDEPGFDEPHLELADPSRISPEPISIKPPMEALRAFPGRLHAADPGSRKAGSRKAAGRSRIYIAFAAIGRAVSVVSLRYTAEPFTAMGAAVS